MTILQSERRALQNRRFLNMPKATVSATEIFALIAKELTQRPGITLGSGNKGFGASALQVHGKIFAFVSNKGRFVVKLPKHRVASLVTSGEGILFDAGNGRLMKEWLALEESSSKNWLPLTKEGLEYVGSKVEPSRKD